MTLIELIGDILSNLFEKPKKQNNKLNFSIDNVQKLSSVIDEIGDILIKTGNGHMVDHLSKIRLAAERNDVFLFNKYVLSKELFGGAGSMRDTLIEDKDQKFNFKTKFIELLSCFIKIGIVNSYINKLKRQLSREIGSR